MYQVYFKTSHNFFRVFDGLALKTLNYLPKNTSLFYLTKKGYDASDESLKEYYCDIKVASDELYQSDELRGFDYLQAFKMQDGNMFYKSHTSNVKTIFNMRATYEWKSFEEIDITEASWFKQSQNGGLQYCRSGDFQSYGYDFNMFYPRLLGDKRFSELQIPIKKGTEEYLSELPAILQYGFYRINVLCDNPNFTKVFSLSRDKVYTHYSVSFLLELIRKHNFNIDIQLIQDGEANAYIYNDIDLIPSYDLFKNWFSCLLSLKKKYPKNILVKMLSSSLWGHLSQKNTICVDSEKIDEYDVDLGNDADYKILDIILKQDGSEYYKLLNSKKPYKLNLRLKPFITSYGRNKTARVALRMIDNVIRIHTDGVAFNQPYTVKSENLLPEAKTTGKFRFNNVNNYQCLE